MIPYAKRPGFVYFLQVEGNGPVKVGFTKGNPLARLACIQRVVPYRIDWVGGFRGTFKDEREFHRKFKEYCIRSEWYVPCKKIISFINERDKNRGNTGFIRSSFHMDLMDEISDLLTSRCRRRKKIFSDCLRSAGIRADRQGFYFGSHYAKVPSIEQAARAKKAVSDFKELLKDPENLKKCIIRNRCFSSKKRTRKQ